MRRIVVSALFSIISQPAFTNPRSLAAYALRLSVSLSLYFSHCSAEAIPGACLQAYAIIDLYQSGQTVPGRAIVSLVISVLTAGFTSATIR
jgi:hypothetical protein